MELLVSSLIKGFDQMEEIARWVNSQKRQWLGVELIAFTHDSEYWKRLEKVLERLTCPVSFHGPYIGVEAASPKGTKEYSHLLDSYERVCALGARHQVRHVVFHYTQKGVTVEERKSVQEVSRDNIRTILDIGLKYGVEILVENLPAPQTGLPLYENEEYTGLYEQFPDMKGIVDMGHAALTGLDLPRLLEHYGSRICAYHFHNNDGKRDCHNRLEDGVIDYTGFSRLFKQYTPKGRIVLEYEPHAWISQDRLWKDIEWVRSLYSSEENLF